MEEDQSSGSFKLEKTLHDKAREKYKQDLEQKYVDSEKDTIKGNPTQPLLFKTTTCTPSSRIWAVSKRSPPKSRPRKSRTRS